MTTGVFTSSKLHCNTKSSPARPNLSVTLAIFFSYRIMTINGPYSYPFLPHTSEFPCPCTATVPMLDTVLVAGHIYPDLIEPNSIIENPISQLQSYLQTLFGAPKKVVQGVSLNYVNVAFRYKTHGIRFGNRHKFYIKHYCIWDPIINQFEYVSLGNFLSCLSSVLFCVNIIFSSNQLTNGKKYS